MDVRKWDMKIERLLRGLAAGAGGRRAPKAGLEIRQSALEALDERLSELGCAAGTAFPFNSVEIELAVGDGGQKELVEAAFADRALFTREVAARIIATGARPPSGLTVEVRAIDTSTSSTPCTIRFEHVERAPPRVRLVVIRGAAFRRSYSLQQERVCVGRGEEVTDKARRLLQRNDVVFDDAAVTVSRRHARLLYDWESESYFVVAESRSRGVQVCRGNAVLDVRPGDSRGVRLESGDEIRLGEAVLAFKLVPS